ncbi:MAG: glycosyltransferase family 9 protein [Cyanobium sp. LacPavin_0920_WC12_MAG_62_9]|nr:glycosyltransferase family 9 protein [Cyanobium sp. LacPavin_0920_WC12_MAG_62_9]
MCWLAAEDAERVELPWRQPEIQIPTVLIAVNGEREAKLWPLDHWLELLGLIQHRLGIQPSNVGLVGAAPPAAPPVSGHQEKSKGLVIEAALVKAGVQDLRGKLSLTELVGAFRGCALAICVDSGPLHLAAAAGCPTVAIFGTDAAGLGASPQRLWAPRQASVKLATSSVSCSLCQDERFLNPGCLLPEHGCLLGVSPTTVVDSAIQATRQTGHQPA